MFLYFYSIFFTINNLGVYLVFRFSLFFCGWGQASVLTSNNYGIIADFGTLSSCFNKCKGEIIFSLLNASQVLSRINNVYAIISHLDYDHFSLVPLLLKISEKVLVNTFIPGIPVEIKDGVISMLALFHIVGLKLGSTRDIFTEIGSRSRKLSFLFIGCTIQFEPRMYIYVVWPPYRLSSYISKDKLKNLKRKSQKLIDKVNKLIKSMDMEESFMKVYENISFYIEKLEEESCILEKKLYCNNISHTGSPRNFYFNNKRDTQIKWDLFSILKNYNFLVKDVENIKLLWRTLTNSMSLVYKIIVDSNQLALITGDVESFILDLLEKFRRNEPNNFKDKKAFLVQAAHHGTDWGNYLKNYNCNILWIPRCSYCKSRHRGINSNYHKYTKYDIVFKTGKPLQEVHMML